ncbi:MAG: hypothetical protein QXS93_03400 [Candidatus Micrarchaeia archaeon]
MAYVDSLISTGVDQLINLIYKNKRVSLERASKELGIAQKVIEEWSHILEEEGIIKIEYQFTTAYLVWAGESVTEPEKVKELREQRDSLLVELEGLSNRIAGLLAESKESSKKLSSIIGNLSSVSEGVRAAVETLNEIKKEGQKANEEAKVMVHDLEEMAFKVKERMDKYSVQLKEAESSYMQDAAVMETLVSNYDDALRKVRALRETLQKQKDEIDSELSDLSEKEEALKTRLATYSQLSTGKFDQEIKNVREEFESVSQMYSSLNETLEKRLDEMRLALKTINDFSKDVEVLESKISEDVIARRYAEVKRIADMLAELEDEEERLDKKLKLLIRELQAIKIEVSPTAVSGVSGKLEEAKEKIKETKRDVTMMEQKRQELIDLMRKLREEKEKRR